MRTRSHPKLYLTDTGAGEPVLVITGWTISSAVFETMSDRLTPTVRVIAYDHRGTGRSAPWLGPVSAASLAADAARVLEDRGLESAHIVGLSLGAGIALELAVRMPHRVRSLCLVGGAAGGPSFVLPAPRDAVQLLADLTADSVRHRKPWPAAALFSARFRDEHSALADELTIPFTENLAPPWAAWWQTLAVTCMSRASSLPRLSAPTLILHGGQDVMTPPGNARLLAERIPNAELHIFEDAGHAAPFEHPEACTALMLEWFARHAGRTLPTVTPRGKFAERATRPFSLVAGSLRNTRDAIRL
jgi:3-oxoadipate enol-lactonase